MQQVYEWKQPVGGKAILWRPLKVGQELDIAAANRRPEQQHLVSALVLAARIVKYGDAERCSLADVRDWDEYDFEAFVEETNLVESQRRAALRKGRMDQAPIEALEAAVEQANAAANAFNVALRAVLDHAKACEAAQSGPLK
jgi:hypothetical protein